MGRIIVGGRDITAEPFAIMQKIHAVKISENPKNRGKVFLTIQTPDGMRQVKPVLFRKSDVVEQYPRLAHVGVSMWGKILVGKFIHCGTTFPQLQRKLDAREHRRYLKENDLMEIEFKMNTTGCKGAIEYAEKIKWIRDHCEISKEDGKRIYRNLVPMDDKDQAKLDFGGDAAVAAKSVRVGHYSEIPEGVKVEDRKDWVHFIKKIKQPETPGKDAVVKVEVDTQKTRIGNNEEEFDRMCIFLCEEFEGRGVASGSVKSFNPPKDE